MPEPSRDDRQPSESAMRQDDALRCHCGSLLARVVQDGVEIKCRRCKRRLVIPFSSGDSSER